MYSALGDSRYSGTWGPLSSRGPRSPSSLLRAPPRDALLSVDAHKGSPTGGSPRAARVTNTSPGLHRAPWTWSPPSCARPRATRGNRLAADATSRTWLFGLSLGASTYCRWRLERGVKTCSSSSSRRRKRTRIINHRECLPGKDN